MSSPGRRDFPGLIDFLARLSSSVCSAPAIVGGDGVRLPVLIAALVVPQLTFKRP